MAVDDDRAPGPELESREPTLEDLRDLCRELNARGARYVVIGGFAIRAAGYIRRTMDVDLLVAADPDNEARVFDALATLPDQAVRELQPGELGQYAVIRVADEILVDLMRAAGGIDYAEAAPFVETHDVDGVPIPFASPRLLWRTNMDGGTGMAHRDRSTIRRFWAQGLSVRNRTSNRVLGRPGVASRRRARHPAAGRTPRWPPAALRCLIRRSAPRAGGPAMTRHALSSLILLLSVNAAAQTTIALPDVQKPHQIVVEGNDLYVFDEADYILHAYTISPFASTLRMGRKGDGPYDFKYLPFLYLRPDALVFTDFTKTLWFSRKGAVLKVTPYTELRAFRLDEETLLIPVKDRYVKITADHVRDKRHVQLLDSGFATLKELYVGPFTWQTLAPVHYRTDTVGYEDLILISDTQKGFHITVFDLDGRHLRTIDLSREVEQVGIHPLMHQYGVSNGRIYATTYKKVGGKTEMLVLDLEGRLLRRLYLPLASIRPTRGVLRYDLFCVDGERLYELVENRDTGKWELVITDLKQAG